MSGANAGQAAVAAALAVSLSLGAPHPAFADDNLSPAEKRAAAVERRRELLKAA